MHCVTESCFGQISAPRAMSSDLFWSVIRNVSGAYNDDRSVEAPRMDEHGERVREASELTNIAILHRL